MGSSRIVLITHPSRGARAFARRLVAGRLAACVTLTPVASVYRWGGRIEEARETQLVVKTTRERLAALERFLASEHPYDVPECVALDPVRVEARYQAWLREAARGP